MSLVVTLPYPVSANRVWRTRIATTRGKRHFAQTYLSEEAKAFKEQVGWRLKAAGVRSPIPGRVSVSFVLYPPRPADWQARQRKFGDDWDNSVACIDLDNAVKLTLDAMKNIAFDDDSWVWKMTQERAEPDADGARLVVTIEPIVRAVRQFSLLEET